MQYLYTNAQLGHIIEENAMGKVDWEGYGFNVREVGKAISGGMQFYDDASGRMISLLPISDLNKLTAKLGNLIAAGTVEDDFYQVIPQEQAVSIRDEARTKPTYSELEAAANILMGGHSDGK